jgi:hypothetical protein
MRQKQPARFATVCKRLSLLLSFGIAVPVMAQDGQRDTGVPVTNPETDKEVRRTLPPAAPGESSADLLPPVPASVNDPAPFGTRAVGVAPGAGAVPVVEEQASRAQLAGIRRAEGVVIGVEPPKDQKAGEKSVGRELIRLRFDPNQTWLRFSTEGPNLKPTASAGEVKNGAREVVEEAPAQAGGGPVEPGGPIDPIMTVVVTKNTNIFVHARTREGQDLYGVPTVSSPSNRPSGRGVTGRLPARQPTVMETNFTNIKEGSFISVRYRMVGNLAEAVNLNLIEYPVVTPGEAASVPGPVPTAVPGEAVGPNARGVPNAKVAPNAESAGAPARVPVVPGQPNSPGTLPK